MKKTNVLKTFALENNIPIITDDALEFIIDLIQKEKIKNILEIGTAIGYSAIMMAPFVDALTTIERDPEMAEKARFNIKEFNLEDKIKVIQDDAHHVLLNETYDLIFIDAAKAQYEKFFIKFEHNLSKHGMIICDNLNFHHLDINKVNKNTKRLLLKLQAFKQFLKDNKDFLTTFYEIGDGLSISRRIK